MAAFVGISEHMEPDFLQSLRSIVGVGNNLFAAQQMQRIIEGNRDLVVHTLLPGRLDEGGAGLCIT